MSFAGRGRYLRPEFHRVAVNPQGGLESILRSGFVEPTRACQ